jgi:hypothetical protein
LASEADWEVSEVSGRGRPMDINQHGSDGQAQDIWLSVVSASMAFLDSDGAFGAASERTRAAKLRLAAAVEDFCAYQDDLGRGTAPLIRRIK